MSSAARAKVSGWGLPCVTSLAVTMASKNPAAKDVWRMCAGRRVEWEYRARRACTQPQAFAGARCTGQQQQGPLIQRHASQLLPGQASRGREAAHRPAAPPPPGSWSPARGCRLWPPQPAGLWQGRCQGGDVGSRAHGSRRLCAAYASRQPAASARHRRPQHTPPSPVQRSAPQALAACAMAITGAITCVSPSSAR